MKKKLLLSLLVAGICLYFALRGINWSEVGASLQQVSVAPLVLVFLMLGLTHYCRARRFVVLLRPIRNIGVKELFAINAVGFLAIHALPLRLGEATRPLLFKRRHEIPFSTGLATITVERVFDGLMAVLALLIGVWASPEGFGEMPLLGMGLRAMSLMMLAIYVPILGFLIFAVAQKERALYLIEIFLRFFPQRLQLRLRGMAGNFIEGLRSLPNVRSFFWILLESMGVWGAMVIAYWVGFVAFHLDLPWSAAFTVLGVSAVGVMLPAAPGFVGTFQLFVQSALLLYGVSKSTGLAYSIVIHALNLLYVAAVGLAFIPSMSTKVKTLFSDSMAAESNQAR